MTITVLVPPPVEPVTEEEVFRQLRLDVGTDEAPEDHPDYELVMGMVASARLKAEEITRRAFVQQTLRLTVDSGFEDGIELPRPPLLSVVSVSYHDESNDVQEVDAGNYFTASGLVPRLSFAASYYAPTVYDRADALVIDYVAGYPPVVEGEDIDYRANIPPTIKQAVLIGTQLLYDDLQPADRDALERARDSLLESSRVYSF